MVVPSRDCGADWALHLTAGPWPHETGSYSLSLAQEKVQIRNSKYVLPSACQFSTTVKSESQDLNHSKLEGVCIWKDSVTYFPAGLRAPLK